MPGLLDRQRQLAEGLLSNPYLPQMSPEVGFWEAWAEKAGDRARFLGSLLDPMTWYRAIGSLPEPGSEESKALFRNRGQGLLDVALDWGVNPIAGGLLGTFKGMNANLSDVERDMLAKAFELEQQGMGREAIRQATNPPGGSGGWFRAPWDQKWRMEIDDSVARLQEPPQEAIEKAKQYYGKNPVTDADIREMSKLRQRWDLPEVLKHNQLYDAYPALERIQVEPDLAMGARGAYSGNGLLEAGGKTRARIGIDPYLSPEEMRSVVLHEAGGHGVQDIEGFARGGSPEMMIGIDPAPLLERAERLDKLAESGLPDVAVNAKAKNDLQTLLKLKDDPLYEDYLELVRENNGKPLTADEVKARANSLWREGENASPYNQYRRLAGEAEARLVQARRDLTPAQRAALDPIEQMDTMLRQEGILGGLDDLIVRYGDGPAMSVTGRQAGLLGRHVSLQEQDNGLLGKVTTETAQSYPEKLKTKWPIQQEPGLLDAPTSYRADKYEGLSPEGQSFIKQFKSDDFRNKTAIHYNEKTGLSLDFSTSCTKRSGGGCNAGACAYCYVEHDRSARKAGMGTPTSPKKLVENDYEDEILRMPADLVTNLNRDGGLRMFSFGDFRPGIDDNNVARALTDAQKRGLYVKAITKEPELIKRFGDHPNFRANLSIDYLPREASNSFTIEDAVALKAGRDNIKLRGVALNMEEAERMAADPRIDVITLYHGPTGDRLYKIVAEQNPKLIEKFGGEEALRAELNRWQNMSPRSGAVKEFMERNAGRVCCQGGEVLD